LKKCAVEIKNALDVSLKTRRNGYIRAWKSSQDTIYCRKNTVTSLC